MLLARLLLIATVLCVVAAAPAHAHDSLQPAGTPHGWLPDEDWVMQHWLPFDETRLYASLGVDNVALEAWLRNDHRTIADLAARRTGATPDALADHLVAPWNGVVPPDQYALLRERTLRLLTQGHLAQHVFFHYFHGTNTLDKTERIFGLRQPAFLRLRARGMTPIQAGARGRRSARHVTREFRTALADGQALGVRRGEQSSAQAEFMLHRRTTLLPCFLRRPLAKFDQANPYGQRYGGHGNHPRGTRSGLRADSKQRQARKRPKCCWKEPRQPLG